MAVLEKVAAAVHDQRESLQLAVQLKLPDNEVYRLLEPMASFSQEIPLGVLLKWRELGRTAATGAILYGALYDIEREDIAQDIEEEIFGGGELLVCVHMCVVHACSAKY